MNKVYKTVWNKSLCCWQVTSELKKGYSRGSKNTTLAEDMAKGKSWFDFARLSLLSLALLPISVWAGIYDVQLPTGGNVTVGSAEISQNNNNLNIHQNSQNVGIQWDSFNIGQNGTVNFHQPNSSSIAVNRVLDSNASQIMGKLNANGQVFLLNPNGVIFSKTAQVNVGGIVASTLNVTDGDIMSGNFTLKNHGGKGKVENHGSIIAQGGVVAFIAPTVINTGDVQSKNGVVHFTAADQVTLRLQDGQLTEYQVDIGTLQGLIDNSGAILANNGAVYLTAKAKDSLSKAVVNHSGIIEANRLSQNAKGEIVLLADMEQGTANINGILKAEGKNGLDGGFIETSAATVHVGQATQVSTLSDGGKTGTWLIDPTDFTISAGNASATSSGIGATTLQNNLNTTSVKLQTQDSGGEKGDIHVNAAVTWNKDTILTLEAHNDININANITAQHQDGKVELIYGQNGQADANYHLNNNAKINLQAGQNFSTQKGTDAAQRIDYTVITQLGEEGSITTKDLQGINGDLSGNYVLGADIDASDTANWGAYAENGFNPLGNEFDGEFTGRFDGLGHNVSDLTIDRKNSYGVGLFGYIQDAVVRNVGIQSGSIRGDSFVGGLVGQSTSSLIENSFSRANIEGYGTVGGLVGGNYDGSIIKDSYATGNVTGQEFSMYVGGLAGANDSAHIENSYATGQVKGDEIVGGLVGENNNNAAIDRSYATGNVTGLNNVGGLAGNLYYGSAIKDSYATGQVTGQTIVGGLVGENLAASVDTSYAIGKVIATATGGLVGGLQGQNIQGTVQNSFWDKDLTTQQSSAGSQNSSGLNSNDMFKADKFVGFDFKNIWGNANNQTTPYLQNHKGSNQVINKNDATGGFYGVIQTIQQLQAVNNQLDGRYLIGNDIDAQITKTWGDIDGDGFKSIGDVDGAFTGVIDGLGHQVSGLYIKRENSNYVGLIGYNQGTIKNLGLTHSEITGQNFVGALVGKNEGQISRSYSTGSVTGRKHVGGLLGSNNQSLNSLYSFANVNGQEQVGGLVGQNTGQLTDIYTTGNVTGDTQIGGLVGHNSHSGKIINAYTTGSVQGVALDGGVVGQNDGQLSSTYWNKDKNEGLLSTENSVGLTSEQMKQAEYFAFLDENSKLGGKNTAWRIYDGHTGPLLRDFLTTVDLSLQDKTTIYNGKEQHFADVWGLDSQKYIAEGNTSGINAGNYQATYYSNDQQGYDFIGNEGTLTINKAQVTVTGSSESDKIYNGQNQAMNRPGYTVSGMVNNENESLLGNITASGANGKNAGHYVNKITGDSSENQNYEISYVDGKFTINKKQITVTAQDETREYNGFNQQVNGFKADGLVNGEDESVLLGSVNALATRKDAGIYTHAVAYKNNGLGDTNYDITFVNGTYTITKATATVKGENHNTIYNGNVQNIGGFTVSGLKGNDKITVLGNIANTAASGKNAGQYENVVTGEKSSSNYNIVYENGSLNIAKKQITGTITAQDKVYDGTTHANVSGSLNGVIQDDVVNLNANGQFADKNAGLGKHVNVSGSLNGTDAGNYELQTNHVTQANISKKQISGTLTAQDKIYDGTTHAIVNGSLNREEVIAGDQVAVGGSGHFIDKNAGENKVVNASSSLIGDDAMNYELTTNGQVTANISKKQITGTITAQDKVYDGTTNAIVNGSLNGVIQDDVVNLNANGQFTDKNAGSGKGVNVSGSLNGTDAGNYALEMNHVTQANISKKQITGTITAQDKVYDGTTHANVSGSLNDVIQDDVVNLNAQGQFADKNAGLGKDVNVSGSLNGTDAGNYELEMNHVTQANISKKQITGTITAQDKAYDGTTHANVSGSLNGVIQDDVVNLNANGQFTDKNAGSGKGVNVSGSLNGTDAGNYELQVNNTTQANIAKAKAQVIGNSLTATYSGQKHNVAGFTVQGLVGGETASVLTDVTASGASGTLEGTYYNNVSGSDQNYELLFTAGMLKIQESLTVPVLPPIPEKPTLPERPLGQNLFNDQYQRALHVAPKAKQPKQSDDVEIEIVGDGINMDGIHTLTGSF